MQHVYCLEVLNRVYNFSNFTVKHLQQGIFWVQKTLKACEGWADNKQCTYAVADPDLQIRGEPGHIIDC